MPAAKTPENEQARLLALQRLKILDTHAEAEFDAIVKAASLACGVPISLISLVDEKRQWFKANIGLEHVKETPRELAFCAHAILSHEILEVEDATQDPRFLDNPIVLGDPNIRFYAGVPLTLTTGENVGTLCVIDSQPHQLTAQQRAILASLATAASFALENHRLRLLQHDTLTAEQALLEASNYAASIFQNAKDPIIALMLDGTVTHWNVAAEKLFGYSQHEMLGENIRKLVPPERIQDELQRILTIVDSPEGVLYETQRLSKTGDIIDVAVSLAALRNGAGQLIGVTKILHDITEEVRIKRLLATNEAKYRALSEGSPLGVFATDATGACTYTNRRWQTIFGLTLEDSLGHGWSHAIHPLDREKVFEEWQRSATARVEFDLEFRIQHSDGIIRFVHSRARPMLDEQDNITGFVGSVEDVSEHKKTLERLANSEERYRTLYNATPVMMQTIDAQGRLTSVNDYWLEKHGYTREEVLGRHTSEFHTPESAQYARDVVIPMIWKNGFCENIAYQRVKKSGEIFDVILSAHLERDTAGNPLRSMAVLVDVTAENAAKHAILEQKNHIQQIVDNHNTATFMIDTHHKVTHWNKRCEELTGVKASEILGQPAWRGFYHKQRPTLSDLVLSDHHEQASALYPKSVASDLSDKGWYVESWLNELKHGEKRYASAEASKILDTQGNAVGVIQTMIDMTQYKYAEMALLAQKNQIHQILDNQSVATFMIDANHKVTHWNKACALLTGADEQTMLGQESWQGFYPHARPCLADLVLTHEQGLAEKYYVLIRSSTLIETGWHAENWFDNLGGKKRYVIFDAAPIYDEQGNIVAVIETLQDTTESKLNEEQLAISATHLQAISSMQRAILDSAAVAIISTDINGVIESFNPAAEKMLGYAADELIGKKTPAIWHDQNEVIAHAKTLTELLGVSVDPGFDAFVAKARMLRVPDENEWTYIHKNGTRILVMLSVTAIFNEHGQVTNYLGAAKDISERKLAELALNEERQYLTAVIDGTRAGTWQWNVATSEVHFNEYWASILGYTLEELDNLSGSRIDNWSTLVHAEDKKIVTQKLRAHFKNETPSYEAEFRMRHKGGHWVWILARGRVFTWLNENEPEWMYGTHLDITELKQQQDALSQANDRTLVATQSGGIGIWDYDVVNDVLVCDSTMNALYGMRKDDVFTVHGWTTMLHPEDKDAAVGAFEGSIAGEQAFDTEFRVVWPDGSVHYIRAKASITRDSQGKALHMLGTNMDITPLRELALELSTQHETLRVTLQSIGDAVITTDARGRVTWLNPVAESLTGWLDDEAKGKPLPMIFNILNEETRKTAQNPVAACLKLGKVTGLESNTILVSRDGISYGIEDSASPIRSDDGKVIGAVLVFHDVTEQRRLSSEMTYRATHDALTGLVNRMEFEHRLNRVLTQSKADGSVHALMFIDLDQFKLVNDSCGHGAGDILLKQVTKMLSEVVRARDTLARLGGDEFGVILEKCSTEQAQRVAQSICDRMDEYRFIFDGKRFRIGTSIGLCVIDNRWVSIANVIQAADSSCYAAKEAGRNRVHTWFDSDIHLKAQHGEMQWATRIEQALDENHFELYAQRITKINQTDTETVSSGMYCEVLLRLRGESGEIIPPGVFLPAAERFRLATRIDRWVLTKIIYWLKSMDDLSMIDTICVNVSGQSVGDRVFHTFALETLKEAGPELCQRICLEVTETATVTNLMEASAFIENVRQLGVRVALDDFGAGASSFGYLKTLKVDILKIDGQYIKGMLTEPLDNSAVRCFVDVANIMKLKTVAEYVETEEALAHLKTLGIDCAQGFLLDKPAPIDMAFSKFLALV